MKGNMKKVLLVFVFGVLTFGLSGICYAGKSVNWNSEKNSLYATGYGSWARGYGSVKISTGNDGTRLRTTNKGWYFNADNHKVYVQQQSYSHNGSAICVAPEYISCRSGEYVQYATNQSTHYQIGKGKTSGHVPLNTLTGLDSSAGKYYKAIMTVNLDIPWRFDIHSGDSYTKGIKF
jgi:hypothetical protein